MTTLVAAGDPQALPWALDALERGALVAIPTDLPDGAEEFAGRFWPGPLTIALPRGPRVPDLVTAGGDTVGLRMPDHPFALALIEAAGGALAVTSANRSGEPSLREAAAVAEAIGGWV